MFGTLLKWVPKIEAAVRDLLTDFPAVRDAVKKIISDIEKDLAS